MLQPSAAEGQSGPGIPALRATAIVGIGSLVTLGLSVVTMKAYALLVGPEGVGILALLQATVNLGVGIAGLGVATSAIAALAAALSRADATLALAVERAAIGLGLAGGFVGGLVLLLARDPIAENMLGSDARSIDLIILAPALLFALAATIQVALLTGAHRIRAVTAVNIGTSAAAAGFGVLLVAIIGIDGLAPGLLVTSCVQLLLSLLARNGRRMRSPPLNAVLSEARGLLKLGLPVAASQLANGGAAFVVPLLVVQAFGQAEVGLYRAASAISVGYLAFFLAALTQDYLPRISAARDNQQLGLLVERRMRLVMGLAVPVVLGLLAAGPWLVELLYSGEFADSFGVLQWQLVGDLVRLPAWVLAFVLLARGTGSAYLGLELFGGLVLVGGTAAGLSVLGLNGAGVGYAAAQVLYYAAVWWMVRRHVPTTPGRLQAVVISTAIACSVVLVLVGDPFVRLVVLGISAIVLAAVAWPRLYRLAARGEL